MNTPKSKHTHGSEKSSLHKQIPSKSHNHIYMKYEYSKVQTPNTPTDQKIVKIHTHGSEKSKKEKKL